MRIAPYSFDRVVSQVAIKKGAVYGNKKERVMSHEKNKHQVKIKASVEGQKHIIYLDCEKADKLGFHSPLENHPFPLSDFLDMACNEPKRRESTGTNDPVCPNCGLTFSDFAEIGRFGCGFCYEAFRTKLENLMTRIHGSNRHCGYVQPESDKKSSNFLKVKRLNDELKEAVQTEDYERAAEIRDKLNDLD